MSKFLSDIISIISQAKTNAIRSVDFERVIMYWKLGERIFVEENNRVRNDLNMERIYSRT